MKCGANDVVVIMKAIDQQLSNSQQLATSQTGKISLKYYQFKLSLDALTQREPFLSRDGKKL